MSELAIIDTDYAWGAGSGIGMGRGSGRSDARSGGFGDGMQRASSATPSVDSAAALRIVKAVCLAFAGLAAFSAVFFFIVVPATEIKAFELSGASTIDAEELRSWSGLPEKANWMNVDCAAVQASVAAHPRVASVSVSRKFPDALVVDIKERVPVAVVFARGPSGRMEAHGVDAQGVVFAPASLYGEAANLPVLSGLEIRGLRYGLRLEGAFSALLASLGDLFASDPALVSAISELRVVSKEGSQPELLVYPARYMVPVRMRPVLNAGLLKSMMLVLDVVEGEGLSPSIRELDLRTDTFVYRTKEAVSG